MNISAVLITRDEPDLLKDWLVAVDAWADEIVIGLHECTDATYGVINRFLDDRPGSRAKLVMIELPKDAVAAEGFGATRNRVAARAHGDWIVTLDTDEEFEFTRGQLEAVIAAAGDKLAIQTRTWEPAPREVGEDLSTMSRGELLVRMRFTCEHWRIYRHRANVEWRGLVHEELHCGGRHIGDLAHNSEIRMLHFGCMTQHKDRAHSHRLYSELLCRAFDYPALREGTNRFWFDSYYPRNATGLRAGQQQFWRKRGGRVYQPGERQLFDPYGTHLPLLIRAVAQTMGPVLELGCGMYSTHALHEVGRKVYSYEADGEWFQRFDHLNTLDHKVVRVNSYDDVPDMPGGWGVVLVDNAPASRRIIDIAKYADLADLVVIHDTEDPQYGYDMVMDKFKYVYTDCTLRPWTTIASNKIAIEGPGLSSYVPVQ